MASNSSIFSPSASSFLTAPSVVGPNSDGTSSPAVPDSPSSSSGSNGIVTVDSEHWTPSEYSDFTTLSAVSSATPSILSVNSSIPGTNGVPTAPQSPAREAVNDNVNTDNSTSIDTIRPESHWQDREKTPSRASTFSLLRYLSALPAPSGSGSDAFNSFEFPGQDASSATQQQQPAGPEPSSSPFSHYPYSIPPPSTIPNAYPDPPMTSFSPPATVSTTLLDDSRQPSPAPSESVERLAADLMAFSMTSSSKEVPERHQPEEPTTSSSTASSTLIPSPPTPTNAPNVTATTTYEYTLTTSPEPVPKSESPDLPAGQGSVSGVKVTGASIPHNATTASGGFSHSTTQRWPWMDIVDDLFPGHGLDAGQHDGAPLPHIMQVLPGSRPPVHTEAQQPADAPGFFGYLAAPGPGPSSTTVFSEDENLPQGSPTGQLPPPYHTIPSASSWPGFGRGEEMQESAVSTLPVPTTTYSSSLEQDWIQAYSVPTRPLYGSQGPTYPDAPSHTPISTNAPVPLFGTAPFDFSLGVGDADATPRGSGLAGETWRVGSLQGTWDVSVAPSSYGGPFGAGNDHSDNRDPIHPHLPYRVPSPSSFRSTPTPQFSPVAPGQTHPAFGCPLFAPPSPTNTTSTEADSVYGLKRVAPTTHQHPSSDQEFQADEEVETRDTGKGRLAVNTEEARQAYERAVEARKKFRGEAVYPSMPPGPLFDTDGSSAQKAYQDAVRARDRLTQRYSTRAPRISQGVHEQPADPISPTQHSDFGPSFSPVQDMSYDLHSYFPASAVPRLQTVSGPSHPTIISEHYPTVQSPVGSLEAIPIVPVSAPPARRRGTPGLERDDWKDTKQSGLEEEMTPTPWELNERPHAGATAKEPNSHATHEFATGYPGATYRPGGLHGTPLASPFIPPSRASSASTSSMYVCSMAPPLQCRPPPSPTSSCTSSDAPRLLPRRRSQRSIRRSTSSHTIPAVSFVLPGPTSTTQTGSPAQGSSNPIHNFQSSYPGMSSGKLSTLNFNESTRPSPWISQVPTGNTSHWGASSGPAPTLSGRSQSGFGCGFGTGAGVANATPNDNQFGSSWPFAPLPNVTPTPAQWPFGGWATGTPGQQQTPAGPWQHPLTGWGGSWFTHPGNTPPGVMFPPQAPMMSTSILPPSTSGPGTTARNTGLPFTQSTALPTYPLPAGQYPGNLGAHSQFMTPHAMGVSAHASDPYAVRSAPPPYNTSPNGPWGNPGPPHAQVTPPGPAGMCRYPLHSKYCFPDSNVAFVVQGIEYRVHRFFFEKHSNQMKEMLAPYPPGLYHTMEPIPLMVSGTDFDKLLSIFYPSNPLQSDLTEAEDFARVIRASQQLGFQDIRKSVIQMASKLNPVERILLSRNHDIKEWAISAYEELCASGKPVSPEDGEKLGATTVIRIWEIQQQLNAQEFCRAGCRKEFLESTVKEKFGLE